jgi:cytochrome c-type biogenesis protein CcmF
MREPDIWMMLTKDFYVTPLSYEDGASATTTSDQGKRVTLKKGESIDYKGNKISFDSFNFPADAMSAMMGGGSFTIGANLTVDAYGKTYKVEPKMSSTEGNRKFIASQLEDIDLLIEMTNLDASGSVNLVLKSLSGANDEQIVATKTEVLSIEASIKPFINLIWSGVILMVIGFMIAVVKRTKETK